MRWQSICFVITLTTMLYLLYDFHSTWQRQGIITPHDKMFYAVLGGCSVVIIVLIVALTDWP